MSNPHNFPTLGQLFFAMREMEERYRLLLHRRENVVNPRCTKTDPAKQIAAARDAFAKEHADFVAFSERTIDQFDWTEFAGPAVDVPPPRDTATREMFPGDNEDPDPL